MEKEKTKTKLRAPCIVLAIQDLNMGPLAEPFLPWPPAPCWHKLARQASAQGRFWPQQAAAPPQQPPNGCARASRVEVVTYVSIKILVWGGQNLRISGSERSIAGRGGDWRPQRQSSYYVLVCRVAPDAAALAGATGGSCGVDAGCCARRARARTRA